MTVVLVSQSLMGQVAADRTARETGWTYHVRPPAVFAVGGETAARVLAEETALSMVMVRRVRALPHGPEPAGVHFLRDRILITRLVRASAWPGHLAVSACCGHCCGM